MKKRIAIIGVGKEEYEVIRQHYDGTIIYHECLPKIISAKGKLYVERNTGAGMLPVDKVVYYGIFKNDFDLITGLALWGGACYPNAFAMMNCRLKLPCLARAIKLSKFADARGFISADTPINSSGELVAKWGNWHCGENKHKFTGKWTSGEAAVLEPFFEGNAVRIAIIGDQHWQIQLEGKNWLKSLHDERADFMEVDEELLEDTRTIKEGFGLDIIANDYIVGKDGQKYLLEVNHIPNITRFELLRQAYIESVIEFINC